LLSLEQQAGRGDCPLIAPGVDNGLSLSRLKYADEAIVAMGSLNVERDD